MKKITSEEYEKAYEIVSRYEYQQKPQKYQVSVTYDAEISFCINVPKEMPLQEIYDNVKDGDWYGFDKEDENHYRYRDVIELIVNGKIIDLNKIKK